MRVDHGNTAWLLICTPLVWLMVPGLACLYGSVVRRKNLVFTLMMNFIMLAMILLATAS